MTRGPRLQPHAEVLHRGHGTVQVGLVPGAGVILDGVGPAEIELLTRLDGSRELAELRRQAERGGSSSRRLDQLLEVLRRHALLLDPRPGEADSSARWSAPPDHSRAVGSWPAQPPPTAELVAVAAAHPGGDAVEQVAGRARRTVAIDGCGQFVDALVASLRGAGVGQVQAGSTLAASLDAGLRARATDPSAALPVPDVLVLAAAGALPPDPAGMWLHRGVPHLPVVYTGHRVSIGPLVRTTGPCLHCLDLHRADRDPQWPQVLAQLAASGPSRPRRIAPDRALSALAAGWATMLTLMCLDDTLEDDGSSIEVTYGRLEVVRRIWRRHPRCGLCARSRPE